MECGGLGPPLLYNDGQGHLWCKNDEEVSAKIQKGNKTPFFHPTRARSIALWRQYRLSQRGLQGVTRLAHVLYVGVSQ